MSASRSVQRHVCRQDELANLARPRSSAFELHLDEVHTAGRPRAGVGRAVPADRVRTGLPVGVHESPDDAAGQVVDLEGHASPRREAVANGRLVAKGARSGRHHPGRSGPTVVHTRLYGHTDTHPVDDEPHAVLGGVIPPQRAHYQRDPLLFCAGDGVGHGGPVGSVVVQRLREVRQPRDVPPRALVAVGRVLADTHEVVEHASVREVGPPLVYRDGVVGNARDSYRRRVQTAALAVHHRSGRGVVSRHHPALSAVELLVASLVDHSGLSARRRVLRGPAVRPWRLAVVEPHGPTVHRPLDVVDLPCAVQTGVVDRRVVRRVLRRVDDVGLEAEPERQRVTRELAHAQHLVAVHAPAPRGVPVLRRARLRAGEAWIGDVRARVPSLTAVDRDVDVAVVVARLDGPALVVLEDEHVTGLRGGSHLGELPRQYARPVVPVPSWLNAAVVIRPAPPRAVSEVLEVADANRVLVPVVAARDGAAPVLGIPPRVVAQEILEVGIEDPQSVRRAFVGGSRRGAQQE